MNVLDNWVDTANNAAIREMRYVLNTLAYERENIIRQKHNMRFELESPIPDTKTKIRDLNASLRDIGRQRSELVTRINLLKNPNWTKPTSKPKPKTITPHVVRALGAKKLDEPLSDLCGICMETHTMRDGLHTSCGHCYGAVCYEVYRAHLNRPLPSIPCPMCRRVNILITTYRPRKTAHEKLA